MNLEDWSAHKLHAIEKIHAIERLGTVGQVVSNTVYASLPNAAIGELCFVFKDSSRKEHLLGEVVAFDGDKAMISCLEPVTGISNGASVLALNFSHRIRVHDDLLGKILDGFGRPMGSKDFEGALSLTANATPVIAQAPNASDRPPIDSAFTTGLTVIDGLMTLGRGQRVGVFAGPGCGKSTLLAQIARGADADVIVLGLVGERGRELREFLEREFDEEMVSRTVFVCSTSDKSAIERVRAAFTATAIAEKFRDEGKSVLLMIDSLTRLARAQREIGLMTGEPATRNGFTPSVYALLPTLIERAGRTDQGDITAIYTILLETDEISDDPIASEAKSLLDGHIILSKDLVYKSHFPAIHVLNSLSRVMVSVVDSEHIRTGRAVREIYSRYKDVELLLRINEYQRGVDPKNDSAIELKPKLDNILKQELDVYVDLNDGMSELSAIAEEFYQAS
ncbi:MAG: FliI/YscN family ATPase [Burkholderiaceae bacterium]